MGHPEEIRELIRVAADGTAARLIAPASRTGADGDHSRPGAVSWLRLWRPRHPVSAGDLPTCGCRAGRCVVCN